MSPFFEKCRKLLTNDKGATATEYAVIIALIIIVVIAAVAFLGRKVNNTFNNMADQMPDY